MANEKSRKHGIFSKLLGRSQAAISPPPYATVDTDDLKPIKLQIPGEQFPAIEALSIPEWTWTNAQCREWLCKFLVSQCGRSIEDASQKSAKFEGFGPNLYLNNRTRWEETLDEADAYGIHALLLSYKIGKKVLPKGITIVDTPSTTAK